MDHLFVLAVPILLLFLLLRLMVLPIRLVWKLIINSGCGFLCLWLLNFISGYTGVYFPINAFTALIAGFLGLPGIGVLTLVQTLL